MKMVVFAGLVVWGRWVEAATDKERGELRAKALLFLRCNPMLKHGVINECGAALAVKGKNRFLVWGGGVRWVRTPPIA
jgi:hypothetical protein